MKLKKGGGKFLFLSLIAGTLTAAICLAIGTGVVIANALPMGVSAALFYSFRDKWLEH